MEPTQLLDRLEVFKYRHFLILKTADCSHVRTVTHKNKNWQIKLWRIHAHSPNSPRFPLPMFPSIRYMVFVNLIANIFSIVSRFYFINSLLKWYTYTLNFFEHLNSRILVSGNLWNLSISKNQLMVEYTNKNQMAIHSSIEKLFCTHVYSII